MDNKYKFIEGTRTMSKNETRRDKDPYIFGEPEPIASQNMKNIKPITPRNSKVNQNGKSNAKSRGKCIKSRTKELYDGRADKSGSYEMASNQLHHKLVDRLRIKTKRQQSRDHMLLYYPRAGDEISDSESSGDESIVYQRHWFSGEPNTALTRSVRLSQLRSQLRRRFIQLNNCGPESEDLLRQKTQCLLEAAYRDPASTARAISIDSRHSRKFADGPLLVGGKCGAEGCRQLSLPCTRHCSRHIMMNADQLLFEHCTAKFADNTQCCVPVFDVTHELPLCPEHARKKDNYQRKSQESKPKKARKKPVSPTVPRPKPKSKPKKRKRPPPPPPPIQSPMVTLPASPVSHPSVPLSAPSPIKVDARHSNLNDVNPHHHFANQIIGNDNHAKTLNNLNLPQSSSNAANLNLGLGLGSLGLGGSLKVELSDHEVFASLDPTEHDFGNVLNNLPADAFNDLFIESRNGEYEPSREEEEELERALEAVDKDVRNLERMGQTHGLLEPALLAQLMSDIAS